MKPVFTEDQLTRTLNSLEFAHLLCLSKYSDLKRTNKQKLSESLWPHVSPFVLLFLICIFNKQTKRVCGAPSFLRVSYGIQSNSCNLIKEKAPPLPWPYS